jgi:hypothetical protein
MAITKRVIVLEQTNTSPLMFRCALWADVPSTRVAFYAAAQSGMTSAWKDASAGDITALQNGTVTERVDTFTVPIGSTLVQAEAILAANWTAWNTSIQNGNPWVRYGTFMDTSNVWTAGGVS